MFADGVKTYKTTKTGSSSASRWKSILNSLAKQVSQVCKHVTFSRYFLLRMMFYREVSYHHVRLDRETCFSLTVFQKHVEIYVTLDGVVKQSPTLLGTKLV